MQTLQRRLLRNSGIFYTQRELRELLEKVARETSFSFDNVLDISKSREMFCPDKIRGMILGAILGDALGAPHEFYRNRDVEYTGILTHKFSHFNRYTKKTKSAVVGQPTDDTEMALCIMRNLTERGFYPRLGVLMDYIKWANFKVDVDDEKKGNSTMGVNTRNLLKGVTTIAGYEKRYRKFVLDKPQKEWTQSNGALMRCYPLSLVNDKFVQEDCFLTNPHPVCLEAEFFYIHTLRKLLSCKKLEIKRRLRKVLNEEVKCAIFSAVSGENVDVSGKDKGWVCHALYCGLFSLGFSSYAEGINAIIQKRGDTDTNACVAGALLGAKFGYRKMMEDPVTRKNIEILLAADPAKGDMPRPERYTIHDIETLITRLISTLA